MQPFLDWLNAYTERWSDLWVLLTAVATTAAVIVALIAAVSDIRARTRAEADARDTRQQYERDRLEEDRARRLERRREQGLRVIAWVDHELAELPQETPAGRLIRKLPVVRVINHSGMPVFAFSAHIWETEKLAPTIIDVAVLPPGANETVPVPKSLWDIEHPHAFAYFHDMAGTFWKREQDGDLVELDNNGHPLERW